MTGEATIDPSGVYRYHLTRRWGEEPPLGFVMLNPSTADATADDPTIRRCIGFAKREGLGGIRVVNLYALRATDPDELWRHPDPFGPANAQHIRAAVAEARWNSTPLIVAWGAKAKPGRVAVVMPLLAGADLRSLGVTAQGHPRHPLYVRGDQPLLPWP